LRAQVLWRLGRSDEARSEHEASGYIPARNPNATAQQLDLTRFYNARLDHDWTVSDDPIVDHTLETLPVGLQMFDEVKFDVRGLIQLDGSELRSFGYHYPPRVTAIPVGQRCRRVHFLHAACIGAMNQQERGQPCPRGF
jgi:hypothetical protein